MKEEFISYLWRQGLLKSTGLKTLDGIAVEIISPGLDNQDSGPDFLAAKVRIDGILWAGNVEVHVCSSDWDKHGHQHDEAYDNVILHLVYQGDKMVFNSRAEPIPVLEIKNNVDPKILDRYKNFWTTKCRIPCLPRLDQVSGVLITNWLRHLLMERLERKASEMGRFLNYFSNNWEQVFYFLLARNFGMKTNMVPFGLLAQATPFRVLARCRGQPARIEAILFGQAGMLDREFSETYPAGLKKEYQYQQHKFRLNPLRASLWKFSRLRPPNFPTIRIAQFAMLMNKPLRLFRATMEAPGPECLHQILETNASGYWDAHYIFEKASVHQTKNLGKETMNNIIINTISPLQYIYGKETNKPELIVRALAHLHEIPPERNGPVRRWEASGFVPRNAADTQALLEAWKQFCTPGKCLCCRIGHQLMSA